MRKTESEANRLPLTLIILKEIGQSTLGAFREYPVWGTIFILSEIVTTGLIADKALKGQPLSFDEVKVWYELGSLAGMMGGGFLEVLARFGRAWANAESHWNAK